MNVFSPVLWLGSWYLSFLPYAETLANMPKPCYALMADAAFIPFSASISLKSAIFSHQAFIFVFLPFLIQALRGQLF